VGGSKYVISSTQRLEFTWLWAIPHFCSDAFAMRNIVPNLPHMPLHLLFSFTEICELAGVWPGRKDRGKVSRASCPGAPPGLSCRRQGPPGPRGIRPTMPPFVVSTVCQPKAWSPSGLGVQNWVGDEYVFRPRGSAPFVRTLLLLYYVYAFHLNHCDAYFTLSISAAEKGLGITILQSKLTEIYECRQDRSICTYQIFA
jgi:hypothetical protein